MSDKTICKCGKIREHHYHYFGKVLDYCNPKGNQVFMAASPSAPETHAYERGSYDNGWMEVVCGICCKPSSEHAVPAAPQLPLARPKPLHSLRLYSCIEDTVGREELMYVASSIDPYIDYIERQLSAALSEVATLREVLENGEKMYIVMRNRCANTESELAASQEKMDALQQSHDGLLKAAVAYRSNSSIVIKNPCGCGEAGCPIDNFNAAIALAEER